MTGLGISVNHLSKTDKLAVQAIASDTNYSESTGGSATNVIDMGCLDRRPSSARFESPQKSVRFKGRFCNVTRAELKTFEGVWLKNLSSGEEGTVFLQGTNGSFTTDLVTLNAGKNVVQLEWKGPAGAKPRMVIAEVTEN